jgi:MoaA/NifB/PqqE/SkfB family radical SAM enzyme
MTQSNAQDVLLKYQIRGGENPDLEGEEFEKEIANIAIQQFLFNPHYAKKGLRYVYNLNHFHRFYCAREEKILNYLYTKRPYPSYLEIENTTLCNLRCNICENPYWKHEKRANMTYEKFLELMENFPNLMWIGLTGIGQNLLNPDYKKMLQYVMDKGMFCEIFDNFYMFDDEILEMFVRLQFDKVYCSLDAATKETYKNLRVGSDWDKVISNVKKLDEIKKKNNSHYPELFFHYIITSENIHEVEQYVDFIHSLGVEVQYIQFTRMLHDFDEVKHLYVEVPDDLKQRVIERGEKLGINIGFNVNAQGDANKAPMKYCSVWIQPFIFFDGTVVPCCSLNEQNDRDWQRETSLGNAFDKGFREVWYGDKYTEMLNGIRKGECPTSCDRCVLFKKGETK